MNKVGYLRTNKAPIWGRICRSAYHNCPDEDWGEVIVAAMNRGILDPEAVYWCDIVEFNEAASEYPGTVSEFLDSLPAPGRLS